MNRKKIEDEPVAGFVAENEEPKRRQEKQPIKHGVVYLRFAFFRCDAFVLPRHPATRAQDRYRVVRLWTLATGLLECRSRLLTDLKKFEPFQQFCQVL